MTNRRIFCLVTVILACLTACDASSVPATEMPQPTAVPSANTPPQTDAPAPAPVPIEYQAAFGIDYAQPDLYLAQGEQTQLSDPTGVDQFRADEQGMDQLEEVYQWLHRDFEPSLDRGASIGVATVDQLLADQQMGGCHDWALFFTAVVRELGYPAVVADSYSIAWMELFQAGEAESHIGHVFVEVYMDGRWVLTDPTNGWYVEEGYDPADPVIPITGPIAGASEELYGFYVDSKGSDSWDYGVHSVRDLTQAMDTLALALDLGTIEYPTYTIDQFSRR